MLVCAVDAPEASGSIAPASLAAGLASATATLSVATTAGTRHPWAGGAVGRAPWAALGVLLLMLAVGWPRRRLVSALGAAALLAALLSTGTACTRTHPSKGTPRGTYTVTVRATSPTGTHSANGMLVVR